VIQRLASLPPFPSLAPVLPRVAQNAKGIDPNETIAFYFPLSDLSGRNTSHNLIEQRVALAAAAAQGLSSYV
jgi:hypothetical protein